MIFQVGFKAAKVDKNAEKQALEWGKSFFNPLIAESAGMKKGTFGHSLGTGKQKTIDRHLGKVLDMLIHPDPVDMDILTAGIDPEDPSAIPPPEQILQRDPGDVVLF